MATITKFVLKLNINSMKYLLGSIGRLISYLQYFLLCIYRGSHASFYFFYFTVKLSSNQRNDNLKIYNRSFLVTFIFYNTKLVGIAVRVRLITAFDHIVYPIF